MALLLSERDQKVITAYELDLDLSEGEKELITADHELAKDDAKAASLPLKRAREDTFSGTVVPSSNLSISPTKRRKKDGVGEQEVQDFVTQGSRFNAHGGGFAEADGDVGTDATESEPGSTEESLRYREGRWRCRQRCNGE